MISFHVADFNHRPIHRMPNEEERLARLEKGSDTIVRVSGVEKEQRKK